MKKIALAALLACLAAPAAAQHHPDHSGHAARFEHGAAFCATRLLAGIGERLGLDPVDDRLVRLDQLVAKRPERFGAERCCRKHRRKAGRLKQCVARL